MTNPTNVGGRLSILVVDDDGDLMRATVEMLIRHGFAARGVAGAGAVAAAAANQPDAVVLNPVMRGVDGTDVARTLREKVAGRRPFMIGLTADADAEALLRATPTGFDLYLTKPAIPAVLVGVLNRFWRVLADPRAGRGDAGQR
jgi:CheY-like chemotaxis protein